MKQAFCPEAPYIYAFVLRKEGIAERALFEDPH